jgi:hypothetical protein
LQYLVRLLLGLDLGILDLEHALAIRSEPADVSLVLPVYLMTYSGEILPFAGDISTLISDRSGLLSSSFSAKAMTAFPPLGRISMLPCVCITLTYYAPSG